jgi:hypothetical protein
VKKKIQLNVEWQEILKVGSEYLGGIGAGF